MAKRIFSGKTKRGNPKKTIYQPTKGASKKVVVVQKKNGNFMWITTTVRTSKKNSSYLGKGKGGRR